MHGGTILARSDGQGRGSEFEVLLPSAEALAQSADPPVDEMISSGRPCARLRILVADDSRDAVDALAELLCAMSHTVRCVFDGESAVSAALEFDPDLVLLDIGMPKLDGDEACRQIRRQAKRRSSWICAIPGWGQPDDMRKSAEAGFDRHLVKPLNPETLLQMLNEVATYAATSTLAPRSMSESTDKPESNPRWKSRSLEVQLYSVPTANSAS